MIDSDNSSNGDKDKTLLEIAKEISECQKCALFKTRTKTVPGSGSSEAEIMFIGEAPGENEDKEGIPFCGAAGRFLDEMLNSINMNRQQVFIANTLKCRPPGNRDPEDEEKKSCRPYLEEQIKIINPKLIICLGRHSLSSLLPGLGSITTLHGKALKRPSGRVYLALYHPAAALHNGSLRQTLIDDFSKIPAILQKIEALPAEEAEEEKDKVVQQKLI